MSLKAVLIEGIILFLSGLVGVVAAPAFWTWLIN